MGFQIPTTVYVLDFSDTPLDGLQVKMRGGTLGEVLELRALADIDQSAASVEDVDAVLKQLTDLAGYLVSWDAEDKDGNPIPADLEGLKQLELTTVMRIAQAWTRAQVDVPAPLDRSSTDTPLPDLPDLAHIPVATLDALAG